MCRVKGRSEEPSVDGGCNKLFERTGCGQVERIEQVFVSESGM